MAFSEKLMAMGANSHYLNPPNQGQSAVNNYLGKPVRLIGRIVWGFGSCTIGAVCGVAYHIFQAALLCGSESKAAENRIIEHLVAAIEDFINLGAVVASVYFVILGVRCAKMMAQSFQSMKEMPKDTPYHEAAKMRTHFKLSMYGVGVSSFLSAASALVSYGLFVTDPNEYKTVSNNSNLRSSSSHSASGSEPDTIPVPE